MFLYKLKRYTSIAGLGLLRGIRGYGLGCRDVPIMRMFCYLLLIVAAVEFIIFNFLIIYVYNLVSSEISQVQSKNKDASFLEKLHNNAKIRNLVSNGKDSGFLAVIQDTVERLYMIKEPNEETLFRDKNKSKIPKNLKDIYSFGLDVSHSGEASFIYKRILSRSEFPYEHLIVDIGANDGFISSNSFNFIQFGWNAVLVEPQRDQIQLAKKNLKRYIEINREPAHEVHFVQAVIGDRDGSAYFLKKAESQESYVVSLNDPALTDDRVIQVPSFTVKTLTSKYSIPKKFGILSIDAEGQDLEILRQWFALKFTPAYIIFETLHIKEPLRNVVTLLEKNEYVYIGTRGWNIIYEHGPS